MPPSRDQLLLFPTSRDISSVSPQVAIGPRTGVKRLFRVRYDGERFVHQVFVDRHGWYCAEHGPECVSVLDAQGSIG